MNAFQPVTKLKLPSVWRKYEDHVNYMLGYIKQVSNYRKYALKTSDLWCRLKAEYIREYLPQRKKTAILQYLIDQKIILCDNYYEPGLKSYGYQIHPDFKYTTEWLVQPITNNKLEKKLKSIEALKEASKRPETNGAAQVKAWLKLITIDESCQEAIHNLPKEEQEQAQFGYDSIKNGDELFYCQDRYGRCHTVITSFATELRKYLRYKNNPLSNTDIKNSQPMFLATTIWNENQYNAYEEQEYNADTQPSTVQSSTEQESYSSISSISSISSSNQIPSVLPNPHVVHFSSKNKTTVIPHDLVEYRSLCESGRVYEEMMGLTGLDRKETKIQFYTLYYGQLKSLPQLKKIDQKRYEFAVAFGKRFPSVLAFVQRFKESKGNYRELSWLMQRNESALMIDTVCGRIAREHPEIFFTTIHDSIMCEPEHQEYVQQVMTEEFAKLGFKPSFGITKY